MLKLNSPSVKVLRFDSSGEYKSHEFHNFFLTKKKLYISVLILIPLNKMRLLNVRIITYWMLFEHYCLNILFSLNFRLKLYPCSNRFRISHHVVFFEILPSFSTHVAYLPKINIFPHFDDLTSTN